MAKTVFSNGVHKTHDPYRDVTDELLFLWPTSDDATVAAQMGDLRLCDFCHPRLDVRNQRVVIAALDTAKGIDQARKTAQLCLDKGADSVRIWTIGKLGVEFETLREWHAKYNLARMLTLEHHADYSGFVEFEGTSANAPPVFTEPPRSVVSDLHPVIPLEPRMIPEKLRAWIDDIAIRAWIPTEYPAAAAIVALGGLIGRKLAMRPKRHDNWMVVPNLWGAAVGDPGCLKTAAVEEAMRPLKRLMAEARKDHEQSSDDYESDCLVAVAKKEKAAKKLKEAANKGTDDKTLRELAREIRDADRDRPTPRRHLVNDVTIEKLGEILAQNPNGITLFRDELTGLLNTLEKRGHESDRGFLLECWNGTGSYTFDRIGRGETYIPAACLSIFGTIQPGPLAKMLRKSKTGDEVDGFVPRFQVIIYPDAHFKFCYLDQKPNYDSKNDAYEVFQAIDRFDAEELGCELDDDRGMRFVRFADDAQPYFAEWFTALECRLRSRKLGLQMKSHLAKFRSLMPKLALIFHLVDCVQPGGTIATTPPVSLRAATLAIAWCDLLESHARRIYESAEDSASEAAIKLAEKLQQGILDDPFTFRQVAQKGWTGLGEVEEVMKAVGVLEDRNWLKTVELKSSDPLGRGRPSINVYKNPMIADAEIEDLHA